MQFQHYDHPSLRSQYLSAAPFPHIKIDGAFNPLFAEECMWNFPNLDKSWWHYDNPLEKKFAKDNFWEFPKCIQSLIIELSLNPFISFLEHLTGISGLMSDCRLNGGGLHQIMRGGKLDIHADYNYHPITKLDRRVNVLVYLNSPWSSDWNGQIELWDKEMLHCVKSYEPSFNRMVIFNTTDTGYHGHPEPLLCPQGITRKSIALYYYSNGRPEEEKTKGHSTLYQRRPQDPINEELDNLRKQRGTKRL